MFKTVEWLKEQIKNGKKYEYFFFWQGYLSNWAISYFTIGNVTYWCGEQYMMAQKALTFKDTEVYNEIMSITEEYVGPNGKKAQRVIKDLGRKIRNYDDATWSAVRQKVVYDGLVEKFRQNAGLARYLLRTEEKILVEASPFDAIWGIHMNAKHKDAANPFNWRGENLLGFTLMAVRDTLLSEGKEKWD